MSEAAYELDHERAHEPEPMQSQPEELASEGPSVRTDRPFVSNWLDENSFARGGGDVDTRTSDAFDDVAGVRADTTPSPPTVKAPDDVDKLVQKTPTTTKGPTGYAAWLLEAKALGFVRAEWLPEAQLKRLKAGE